MRLPLALVLAGAWSLGIALAVVAAPGLLWVGAAAGLLALVGLLAAPLVRGYAVPLALAVALAGVARVALVAPAEVPAQPWLYQGRTAAIAGRVADDPRPGGPSSQLLIEPLAVEIDGQAVSGLGNLLVAGKGATRAGFGDEVEAYGRLRLPAEKPDFDRRAYLAQRGVRLELQASQVDLVRSSGGVRRLPATIRAAYEASVVRLLPQPYAALLVGIVLGVKTGIPVRLQNDLIATGLVHLLVLSGLKVAVFARLVELGLRPLLGGFALWPSLVLIGLYALVGGATPAAVRAATMGGLVLLAGRLGRPSHVWTSLALTAAVMLGWHPELAWDVGFQLSFVGTTAIVLWTKAIEHRLTFIPRLVREPFAVTLAAQVATVPLMATDFHLVSPVAPIANALTLPLLPALIAVGILVAPFGLPPLLPIGQVVALPLSGLLAWIREVAEVLARAPLAAIPVTRFPAAFGAAYYSALLGAVAAAHTKGRARVAGLAVSVLLPVGVAGGQALAWNLAPATANVLNVGDGQAVLLSGPQGAVLVDGGPSPGRLVDEVGAVLPPWRRRLNALAITAPTRGHVAGLAGFTYGADLVLLPGTQLQGAAWRSVLWTEVARGASPKRLFAGERFALAGFTFQVLAPERSDPGDELGAGYLALRVVGPSGRSFCDLSDLDSDAQAVAAAHLEGHCDYLLLPSAGASAPVQDLLTRAGPAELIASSASGRLSRDLNRWDTRETAQEGTVSVSL